MATKQETAFPTTQDNYFEQRATTGMSLRDYFAVKAMQALLCADTDNGRIRDTHELLALRYYEIADAMLKARG